MLLKVEKQYVLERSPFKCSNEHVFARQMILTLLHRQQHPSQGMLVIIFYLEIFALCKSYDSIFIP